MTTTKLGTRAVELLVKAGEMSHCIGCDQLVKFQATKGNRQIVCNVYVKDTWNRVEHWHPFCYVEAGMPHGEPDAARANHLR